MIRIAHHSVMGAVALSTLFATACTTDDVATPVDTVSRGIKGFGSINGLRRLHTISYTAQGVINPANEGFEPLDPGLNEIATEFTLTVQHDLDDDELRLDYVMANALLGSVPTPVSEVFRGNEGVAAPIPGLGLPSLPLSSDFVGASLESQTLATPQHILLDVAEGQRSAVELAGEEVNGVAYRVIEVSNDGSPLLLFLNPGTKRIDRLRTVENDLLTRDVEVEVVYGDWQPVGFGLDFPHEIQITSDGILVREESRSNVVFNADFAPGTFDYSDGVVPSFDADLFELGSASSQSHLYLGLVARFHFIDGRSPILTAEELFPGVTQLRGVVHNSLVVEQENGVVVFEAPAYKEQGQAITDWVAQAYPGKPITHVVQSHHHFDHATALRTVLANAPAAVAVAHQDAAAFYTDHLFPAGSSVVPDALELNPRNVTLMTVPNIGSVTLPDPLRPMELWAVPTAHAEDMIIAFLPAQGLLFNADLEAPGGQIPTPLFQGLAEELDTFLINSALPVTTIAGAHGAGLETVAEFRAFWGL